MTSNEISQQLEKLEESGKLVAYKLDQLIEEFQQALPSVAESWILKEVERRLFDNAEKVETIGIEKMSALKRKVRELITRLPEIVQEETKNKSDWPHYRNQGESGYGSEKNEPFFNKSLRNVISHLGHVLNEFGLLEVPKGHYQTWERVGQNKFRYAINPGVDILPKMITSQFDETLKEYEKIQSAIKNTKKLYQQAKTKEMWDAAG